MRVYGLLIKKLVTQLVPNIHMGTKIPEPRSSSLWPREQAHRSGHYYERGAHSRQRPPQTQAESHVAAQSVQAGDS